MHLSYAVGFKSSITCAIMPKTQSHSLSSAGREPLLLEDYINFKVGDRATIKSNHSLFPGVNCTITALPSPDAAIVELDSGLRERLLLKYLKPLLEANQKLDNNLSLHSYVEAVIPDNPSEQPPSNDSGATLVEVEEALSPDEERERHRLEQKVERAFYEAGAALRQLRDLRLYRSTHKTFEEYSQERFGYSRRHPYRLIDAASVVDNLCPNWTQNQSEENLCPSGIQITPTSEGQVRHLTKLHPEEQRFCWQQAVDLADGKVPSGKIVKGVVERLKEKPLNLATDFCLVGDVFTLTGLDGEERKYNGYPCVAIELKHFTIGVEVYDTILFVKPENLKKIDDPDARRQLPAILQRIRQVRSAGQLDRGAEQLLKHLGRQMYLTDVEEKLLSCLETHYQANS